MFESGPTKSPYVLPLTREGYRQWVLRLHNPLVVVLATEQAQRDLERACGETANLGDRQPLSGVKGGLLTADGTSEVPRPSFASLFSPFGCLHSANSPVNDNRPSPFSTPASTHSLEQPETRRYGCPRNVTVKLLDKIKALDVFPVRFCDVNECFPVPSNVADAQLVKAVENNIPSAHALRFIHRLHPYSLRRDNVGSSTLLTEQTSVQLLERIGSSAFSSLLPLESVETVAAPQQTAAASHGIFSNVSSIYPHAALRNTDTYKRAYSAQAMKGTTSADVEPTVKPSLTLAHAEAKTEAEIHDQLYLTVPVDSTTISSASKVPCIWWDVWTETLCRSLEFSEFESLSLPLGFVFVASTRDADAAGAFEELGQLKDLPPLCRQQLTDSSAVRAYVLVHTSTKGKCDWPSEQEEDRRVSDAFGSVCSSFPPSSCHILMFREPTTTTTTRSVPDLRVTLLHAHFDSIQTVVHTIITRSVIPFMERIVKRLSDNLTLHRKGLRSHLRNLWGRRSRNANGTSSAYANTAASLTETALDSTADLLWGAVGGTDETAAGKKEKSSGKTNEAHQVCDPLLLSTPFCS